VETTLDYRQLTAIDRCDRCGGPAKVAATFLAGELLFCGHHARSFNFLTKALTVYDPEGELALLN